MPRFKENYKTVLLYCDSFINGTWYHVLCVSFVRNANYVHGKIPHAFWKLAMFSVCAISPIKICSKNIFLEHTETTKNIEKDFKSDLCNKYYKKNYMFSQSHMFFITSK